MQLDLLPQEKASAAQAAALKKTASVLDEPPVVTEEDKAPGAFRTLSEAAETLGVPQHVLRFWEGRFSQIKPLKRSGGRRYYRPEDMEILSTVKNLLYKQGYTIKGAKKAFSGKRKETAPIPVTAKPALTDRQHSQLSVLRRELIGLRDALKPHVF